MPGPDFLSAINPSQGAWIFQRWVPRARFGLHLRLGGLADRALAQLSAGDDEGYFRAMAEYLHECGISPYHFRLWRFKWRRRGQELRAAFETLVELNKLRWSLPFMEPTGKRGGIHPEQSRGVAPCDYPGRAWAWWVHKLASRYGWTPAAIYEMWPEEVTTYLQEVFIAEYDEADFNRSLSEVAYIYDPQTKKSTFHPLARPGWMVPQTEPQKVRVHRKMLPMGNVVRLADLGNDDARRPN